MLQYAKSSNLLREEFSSVREILKRIVSVLDQATDETNFQKEIGIFAVQMPEYKFLDEEASMIKRILRTVCTGEIQVKDASEALLDTLRFIENFYQALFTNDSLN